MRIQLPALALLALAVCLPQASAQPLIEPAAETAPFPLPVHQGQAGDLDQKPAADSILMDLAAAPDLSRIAAPATQTVFSDGFEGAFPGSWAVFDNNGSTGGQVYWDDTSYRAYAGLYSVACADGGANTPGPGNPYPANMDSWMIYGPFSLSDANAGTFSLRYWNKSEQGFDYFKYLVSVNGTNFYGLQTSGDSLGWQSGSIDFTNVFTLGNITGQPQVWVALVFSSDSTVSHEGAYVDEVLIQKTTGTAADIRIDPLTLTYNQTATTPIYVELDWMEDGTHSHKPSQAVIDRIVQTFAAAGYTIHIDVSNAVPHQGTIAVSNSPSSSPAVQSIMADHFDHSGDSRYYYSLWGHNYSYNGTFTSSSGIADLPGRVHLVTLGSFPGQTGTFSHQVGTLIHEFGHNLNQRHGGADHDHYKPNYLSVMNYHYQLDGIGPTLLAKGFSNTASGFDDFSYSHGLMNSLNEASLNENTGLGLGRSVDWNCNGSLSSSVAKDIQGPNHCSAAGSQTVISDFDNWTSLATQIQTIAAGVAPEPEPVTCLTWEEYLPVYTLIQRMRSLGLLPPDGPGEPRPDGSDAGLNARSFWIYNDGGQPLTVTSMALDVATPWIEWEPQAPFTVPAGGSQEVHVYVDFGQAPAGTTNRRILVQSSDADESPYPGGVFLSITRPSAPACYTLTRTHSGSGTDPVASPANSPGCASGKYVAGAVIGLTASPASGWTVAGWSGTSNDSSTSTSNSVTMPAAAHTVSVAYATVPDIPLSNGPARNDSFTAATSQSTWRYYYVDVQPGSTNLTFELSNMSADLDLYVRLNAKPTLATYNCRPFANGTVIEQCTFLSPASGRWWVGVNNFATGTLSYRIRAAWTVPQPPPLDFHTLSPCRVVNTQSSSPLASGVQRTFTIAGNCGVPASAKAVALNITSLSPTAQGNVVLWPADQAKPATSSINFGAGQTRANNGILLLATNGAGTLAAQSFLVDGGTVHLILDVAGYFE